MCEKESCLLPAGAGGRSRYAKDFREAWELADDNLKEILFLLIRLAEEKSDYRASAVFEEIRKCAVVAREAADNLRGMAEQARREMNPRA